MNTPGFDSRTTGWLWLGPLAFLVHDMEEIATVEMWLRQHWSELPGFAQPLAGITTGQFAAVVAGLFIGYLLAAWHGARAVRNGRVPLPFLIITGVFVANGLTHLLQALYFRGYVPGAVTAALVNVPYGLVLLRVLPGRGIASRAMLGWMILLGLGIQVVIAVLVFSIAGR
jgi:Protein of unknown function with HXXEE motif